MSVLFKKQQFADPTRSGAPKMYYPRLVTLGQSAKIDTIAWMIKERSSLSTGEVLSVLTNFVEVMRECLFSGQTVNIADFGVFSLSCSGEGSATQKECTADKIKQVNINFRPSASVKINTASTRAGEKIEFIDVQAYLSGLKNTGGDDGDDGGDDGGGGIDPDA